MSMSSPSKSPTMEPVELSHPHPKASVTHEHQQVPSSSYINSNINNRSPKTGNSLTTNVESTGVELSDDETTFNNDEKNKEDDFFNSFPPGYRFNPYDEELVVHYLRRKVLDQLLPPNRIIEVNLYRYNPEVLAEKYEKYGEKEWYFFTPRDRKYRNGSRPKRAAGDGYWKATGADKNIYSEGSHVGFRKALVFYKGKPPRGDKTNWIMHEFRVKNSPVRSRKGDNDMRLDRWVLCRIYKKATNSKGRNNNTEDAAATAEEHSPLRQPQIINGTEMMEFEQMSSLVDPYMEYDNNYSIKAAAEAACGMPNVGGHLLHNNMVNRFQAVNINNGGASYANMGQQQHQHQHQLAVRPQSMPLMPESLLGSRYLDDSSITQDDSFFDMKFGNGAYGSMNNYQGQFSPLDHVFPYTD